VQRQFATCLTLFIVLMAATGCHSMHKRHAISAQAEEVAIKPTSTPRELCKTTLPTYRIEPPDILDIEAVRLVPKADYRLNTSDSIRVQVSRTTFNRLVPGDSVTVRVPGAPGVAPIDGIYLIQPDGNVSFGSPYGSVSIGGSTLEEAESRIQSALEKVLKAPKTYVALAQAGSLVDGEFAIEIDGSVDFGPRYGRVPLDGLTMDEARQTLIAHFSKDVETAAVTLNLIQATALQQVVGEHLVGPDGAVNLGVYGSVSVAGMTLQDANRLIEATLAIHLDEPRVSTSVLAYNSKVYYVIAEGGGLGDGVYRFPVTGNETVLDAISLIQGLPRGSSYRMWIARPNPQAGKYVTMPVDWADVTSVAATETNYQLLPGDRLYIVHDPMIAFDNGLAKLISPLERIAGFSILGAETATRLSGPVLRGGGNPRGAF